MGDLLQKSPVPDDLTNFCTTCCSLDAFAILAALPTGHRLPKVLVYRPAGGRSKVCGDCRRRCSQSSGLIARCRAVRMMVESELCAAAPRSVRLPPQTLRFTTAGRMACSPR